MLGVHGFSWVKLFHLPIVQLLKFSVCVSVCIQVEEGKLVRVQLELAQVKADIDRRIHEKEEEFEVTRLENRHTVPCINSGCGQRYQGASILFVLSPDIEAQSLSKSSIAHTHGMFRKAQLSFNNKKQIHNSQPFVILITQHS